LLSGLKAGGIGALGGAFIGGITGALQFNSEIKLCSEGCEQMGINSGDPVPATDEFLSTSQKAWYPHAEMNKVDTFTVEHVPDGEFSGKYAKAGGITDPATMTKNGLKYITGRSSVYFNKNVSFTDARTLYFNMGHELHHVSQISWLGSLGNIRRSLLDVLLFHDMMEFSAYNFRSVTRYNSYQPMMTTYLKNYPNYFWKLYDFSSWQPAANQINPFK
jgi:hypothetical protein